jgi:hypothetical protein
LPTFVMAVNVWRVTQPVLPLGDSSIATVSCGVVPERAVTSSFATWAFSVTATPEPVPVVVLAAPRQWSRHSRDAQQQHEAGTADLQADFWAQNSLLRPCAASIQGAGQVRFTDPIERRI